MHKIYEYKITYSHKKNYFFNDIKLKRKHQIISHREKEKLYKFELHKS